MSRGDSRESFLDRALPVYLGLLFAILTVVAVVLLFMVRHVLLVLFVSVLFAAALTGPSEWLHRRSRLTLGLAAVLPGCDREFIPKSSHNRFCLQHRRTKPPDPAHYRKYGPLHRRLRAPPAWSRVLGAVGQSRRVAAWDLGHVDAQLAYSGPEHAEWQSGHGGAPGWG